MLCCHLMCILYALFRLKPSVMLMMQSTQLISISTFMPCSLFMQWICPILNRLHGTHSSQVRFSNKLPCLWQRFSLSSFMFCPSTLPYAKHTPYNVRCFREYVFLLYCLHITRGLYRSFRLRYALLACTCPCTMSSLLATCSCTRVWFAPPHLLPSSLSLHSLVLYVIHKLSDNEQGCVVNHGQG